MAVLQSKPGTLNPISKTMNTYTNQRQSIPGVWNNISGGYNTGGSSNILGVQAPTGSNGGGSPAQSQPSRYVGAGDSGNFNFGSEGEFNSAIDNMYNPQYSYLDAAERNLRNDQGSYNNEINANYNANSALLGTKKQSALDSLGNQSVQGQHRAEDALSAAVRLFSELRQGNLQRFGGSSSAGQAASEIQGAEQQRQMGQTQRQNNDFQGQIEQQKGQVEQEHQANLLQLEQQKQSAIAQVTRDFQNKLLEITNNRSQLETAKAQAKLQALMDLKNKVFTINQQNMQFAQSLEAMKQQALMNTSGYAQTTQNAVGAGQQGLTGLVNNTTSAPTSQNRVVSNQTQTANPYVGQMQSMPGKKDPLFDNMYN